MTVLNALLEITIYSAVLLAAILLFRVIFKKQASPALLYIAWFVLLARLLVPITIGGISLIVLPAQEAAVQAPQANLSAYTGDTNSGGTVSSPQTPAADVGEIAAIENPAVQITPYEATEDTAATSTAKPASTWQWNWETALIELWLAGIVAVWLNTAIASARLNEHLAAAPPLPDEWQQRAERIQQELGIRGRVRFVMLKDFPSPALNASLRPTVVIPAELLSQDDACIEFALQHELTHVSRGDHLVGLLLMLLKAMYWFNPVVWIANRLMKADMETACDSNVVSDMGDAQKKQYAATILGMYAKEQPRLVLGMALGAARQTAERRMRGIFMRQRSGWRTKAVALLLALVMLIACFTTACQPVTATGSSITGTPSPTVSPSESATPEPSATQRIDKVSSWQDTLKFDDIDFTCNIDAQIVWPDTNVFPVYKVQKREFDAETIAKIAQYFTQGATGMRVTSYTRQELEEQINCYENLPDAENYTEDIADLKEQLANVTDEVFEPVTGDMLTLPVDYTYAMPDDSRVYIDASSRLIMIYMDKFGITQMESWLVDGDAIPGEPQGTTIDNVKISEEDAIQTANSVIQSLNISNLGIAEIEKARVVNSNTNKITSEGWMIRYTRDDANSIPLYFDNELSGLLSFRPDREDYVERWFQEFLSIYVTEDGVQNFIWRYPIEVTEVLENDVTIMPFEDIKAYIKSAIETGIRNRIEVSPLGLEDHEITVGKVILSYVPVPIKDDPDHQILAPVWFIYYYDTNFDRFGKYVSVFAVDASTGSNIDIVKRVYLDEADIPPTSS